MTDANELRINTIAVSIAYDSIKGVEMGTGLPVRKDDDETHVLMDGGFGFDLQADTSNVTLEERLGRMYQHPRFSRVSYGSMPVEGEGPIYVPSSPYRIGIPIKEPHCVGMAAVVYMLEQEHKFIRATLPESAVGPTVLDSKERIVLGETIGTSLLIMMQAGQELRVAAGQSDDPKVYSIKFDPRNFLAIGDADTNPSTDDGESRGLGDGPSGGGKDGGSDRNPTRPRKPFGSAGAAVERPRSRELPPLRSRQVRL